MNKRLAPFHIIYIQIMTYDGGQRTRWKLIKRIAEQNTVPNHNDWDRFYSDYYLPVQIFIWYKTWDHMGIVDFFFLFQILLLLFKKCVDISWAMYDLRRLFNQWWHTCFCHTRTCLPWWIPYIHSFRIFHYREWVHRLIFRLLRCEIGTNISNEETNRERKKRK